MKGAMVRERFQEVVNGLKGAIDFLRDNLNVFSLDNLPYPALLIPLSVFFAIPGSAQVRYTDEQRRTLLKWFWRTCFSKRYNSQPIKSLQDDIQQVAKLKSNQPSKLGDFSVTVDDNFFKSNIFKINTVVTKTFVLLLAQKNPYSFVTGSPISLREALKEYNRNEFHHIYPRAFLKATGQSEYDNSCLANFSFLSKVDNNRLGGIAPNEYRSQMPASVDAILGRALCPLSIFSNVYKDFVDDRAKLLAAEANKLLS